MILDRITLYNFGLYRDYQDIDLSPLQDDTQYAGACDGAKPIVLFGGLNGGGKTTLLDAIQLALYGKLARCSNRNGMAYGTYLRNCIHKSSERKEAALILEFRHTTGGQAHSYRIKRTWHARVRNVVDQVTVQRDGAHDSQLAERWLEFVEDMLPSNIAHLFFFDGEKIEAFADPAQSSDLLRSAMQSLLGLDLVDRLSTDLLALERRHKERALGDEQRDRAQELRATIQAQHETNADLNLRFAEINTEIEQREKRLQKLENVFQKEGGTLFEKRQELETQLAHIQGVLEQTKRELVSIGGDPKSPLLLLSKMIDQVFEQHQREQDQHNSSLLVDLLQERDAWILQSLQTLGTQDKHTEELQQILTQDRTERTKASQHDTFLSLSAEAVAALQDVRPTRAKEHRHKLIDVLARSIQQREELTQHERLLGAVPESDHIHNMIQEREEMKNNLKRLKTELETLQSDLETGQNIVERLEGEYSRILEKVAREQLKRLDAQRLLDHSQRSRQTLVHFREKVLLHNIRRIETMILESFQSLIRKDNFVDDLRIMPNTFELHLLEKSGTRIEASRLSAGERQLLAVSMLWGLARASGRTLPIVIDTPLGRLDSKHRTNLIERYFPKASDQVLLLSTDEEIDEAYYAKLSPWVGRTYHLEYDQTRGCTRVSPGYFWDSSSDI